MPSARVSDKMRNIDILITTLSNLEPLIENPISQMHNYLAKKPYNVISEIIRHLTNENDIVFDGFMGSGTTGYEAIKLHRRFIGVDINRIAVNYFRNATTNYKLESYETLMHTLERDVYPIINDIYSTICPICHNRAVIEREIYDSNDRNELVLKKIKYLCHNCTPGRKAGIYIDARPIDIYELKKLEPQTHQYDRLFSKELLENKHIAIQPGSRLKDYFSIRGQLSVGRLLEAVECLPNIKEKELVWFTISATLHLFKLSDYKASSQIPYWRPKKKIVSRNPVPFLIERSKLIREGVQYSQKVGLTHTSHYELSNFFNSDKGSYIIYDSILSEKVKSIKDESVSLIITDPPYSEQVPYLEYTTLWDILLNLNNITDEKLEKEIVVSNSPKRSKGPERFKFELGLAIQEMGRILKQNHYLCIFYHDFSLDYWKQIIQSCNKADLAFVNQIHIGGRSKSLKTVWDPNKTLDGSALVFFVKNRELVEKQMQLKTDLVSAEEIVRNISFEIITSKGGSATTQELYDEGVLSSVIENNAIEILSKKYKTFIQMFKKWYNYENGKWVLKG